MNIKFVSHIAEIPEQQWDQLIDENNVFLHHRFLRALEEHNCVGQATGWLPRHCVIYEADQLLAAMPLYEKTNSYGELVFDWAWADAYARSGLLYYPKLVSAIPYTPATGKRLLYDLTHPQAEEILQMLLAGIKTLLREINGSSFHCLFPTKAQSDVLAAQGLPSRMAVQFQWQNQNYQTFDDYLNRLSSRKRKKIKRERSRALESGVCIEQKHGDQMTSADWQAMHHFYSKTFLEKSGWPTLTQEFLEAIGEHMPENILVIFAKKNGAYVAGALYFVGESNLYGRHWGCDQNYKDLHFELCYYQGIDYAIVKGLKVFEPGAQGEYKISRGFLATKTWSNHLIMNPQFCSLIERFLIQEREYMEDYYQEMLIQSPYKQTG
ncbi:MAG: GNAT family N-acetyltransferase [Gammaproteobacteria bacterium]|nr:GNAT family N-acetyltransferase [Gammaproteobacteria bacterium]MDH5731218.1 GNAT family N-acetyltransferase [Gammaproteobacteria bacterium]